MSELKIDESVFIDAIKTGDVGLVEKLIEMYGTIESNSCLLCAICTFGSNPINDKMLKCLAKNNFLKKFKSEHCCTFFEKVFRVDGSIFLEPLIECNFDFNSKCGYKVDCSSYYRGDITVFQYALKTKANKCATMILDHYNKQKQGETAKF